MPSLSHLTRAKPETVTVGEGQDTLTLTFDANRVTPRWMNDAMERVTDQDMLSLCKALSAVVTAWDVTEDDGSPVPFERGVALLSFPTVNSLFEIVCRSAAPSESEGNASPASSDVLPSATSEQASPSSLNGSDTSTLPLPSESLSKS